MACPPLAMIYHGEYTLLKGMSTNIYVHMNFFLSSDFYYRQVSHGDSKRTYHYFKPSSRRDGKQNRPENFGLSSTYYLFQNTDPTTQISFPGENASLVDLAAKNSKLTITPPSPERIIFDKFGSPGQATITLVTNDKNITITGNTGFIP